jgi:hypothetical protein
VGVKTGSPGGRGFRIKESSMEVGFGTRVEAPTLGLQGSVSELVDRTQALAATSKIDIVDRKQISFFIAIFDSAFYRIL